MLLAAVWVRKVECNDLAFSYFADLRTIPIPYCSLELSPGATKGTLILHPPKLTQALPVMPGSTFTVCYQFYIYSFTFTGKWAFTSLALLDKM